VITTLVCNRESNSVLCAFVVIELTIMGNVVFVVDHKEAKDLCANLDNGTVYLCTKDSDVVII